MNSEDAFELCFNALQVSLSSIVSNNPSMNNLSPDQIRTNDKIKEKLENAMRDEIRSNLLSAAQGRLTALRSQRDTALPGLLTELNNNLANLSAVQVHQQQELEACLSQKLVSERRLSQQVVTSERRIRELVYEIIGEYGKSDIRFRRRQSYLSYTARIHIVWVCYRNAWDRFAARLCFEATLTSASQVREEDSAKTNTLNSDSKSAASQFDTLRAAVLDSISDAEEIAAVEAKVSQKLSNIISNSSNALRALTIIRFNKIRNNQGSSNHQGAASGSNTGSQNSSFRVVPPIVVETVRDLSNVKSTLRMWAARPVRHSNASLSTDRAQLSKSSRTSSRLHGRTGGIGSLAMNMSELQTIPDFLRAGCIEWLHPSTHYPVIWDRLMSIRGTYTPSCAMADAVSPEDFSKSDIAIDGNRNMLTPALESFIERYSTHRGAFLASERLYYCIEERSGADASRPRADNTNEAFNEMLRGIENSYTRSKTTDLGVLREKLCQRPLEVDEYLGAHRDRDVDRNAPEDVAVLNKCYPDVIRALCLEDETDHSTLHFAAASTFNLLETQAFKDTTAKAHSKFDSERLSAIAQRGAYPPDLMRVIYDNSMASNENLNASEPEQASKLGLNPTYVPTLSRLFCLVRVPVDNDSPETKPKTSTKKVTSKSKTFKRTASTRYSSHGHRKSKSSDSTSADSGDDDDSANESSLQNDTRDELYGAGRQSSRLIIFPLSDLCMREIILTEFCKEALYDAKVPSGLTENSVVDDTLGHKNQTDICIEPASFVNLLPDHARLCLSQSANVSQDFEGSRLNHSYVLVGDDYRDTSDSEVNQPLRQCYYFMQLEGNRKLAQSNNNSAYETISALHESDERYHLGIMLARRSGFGVQDSATIKGSKEKMGLERSQSQIRKAGAVDVGSPTSADEEEGDPRKSKRKWDATILSSVCRWRSCLAECSPASKTNYLCSYHKSLYTFLEGTTKAGTGEAAKYLPKKVPLLMSSSTLSDSKKDLLMIRAASTLLQELWDGKLRATVKSFTKKVSHDMSIRHRLETAMNLTSAAWEPAKDTKDSKETKKAKAKGVNMITDNFGKLHLAMTALSAQYSIPTAEIERNLCVPTTPSWNCWKDENVLNRIRVEQSENSATIEGILGTEVAISDELRKLSDLHTFPIQELTIIKKEVKAFKEAFESVISRDGSIIHSAIYHEQVSGSNGKASHNKAAEEYAAMLAAEARICDRKFNMLRSRRLEEQDSRQANVRRNARARALEEEQAKDPANFSQQR